MYRISQDVKSLSDDVQTSVESLKDEISYVRESISMMKSTRPDLKEDDSGEHVLEDSYSFFMKKPWKKAFWLASCVFSLQIATYALALIEFLKDATKINPFGVPPGVSENLRIVQFLSILIVLSVQTGNWDSLNVILDGFDREVLYDQLNINQFQWFLCNALRITEGLAGLFTVMAYVVRSENIVELLKDVTALLFISEIDEGCFHLAKMGFFGKELKGNAVELGDITYKPQVYSIFTKITGRKRRKGFSKETSRTMIRFSSYFTLFSFCTIFWVTTCVIPQKNFAYMKDSIFIQWDDVALSELGYLSGFYDRNDKSESRHDRVVYAERRGTVAKTNSTEPAIFRFCGNLNSWVLTIKSPHDELKECRSFFAKTKGILGDKAQFDPARIPTVMWHVQTRDNRLLPLKIFMSTSKSFNTDKFQEKCANVETDARYGTFKDTGKTWKTHYDAVKVNHQIVEFYERPLYFSRDVHSASGTFDIILFTGMRWVLVSSDAFDCISHEDAGNQTIVLHYITTQFHPYWSKYRFSYISEKMATDSEMDAGSPTAFRWYKATADQTVSVDASNCHLSPENRIFQKPNYVEETNSILICSLCDNNTNPCFHGGSCINKTCDCLSGSDGTLCELPTNENGHCDSYFNKANYGYDNGDCCVDTCVSSIYTCGKDKTGLIQMGYDECKRLNIDGIWSVTETTTEQFTANSLGASLSVGYNGVTLATVDIEKGIVKVFDLDGSKWIWREPSININQMPITFSSWVDIIPPLNAVGNNFTKSPLTVAALDGSRLHVYDWSVQENNWITSIPFNLGRTPLAAQRFHKTKLARNGLILVAQTKSRTIVFKRSHYLQKFGTYDEIISDDFTDFAVSTAGEKLLILRGENTVYYYVDDGKSFKIKSNITLSRRILALQKGLFDSLFGATVDYDGNDSEIAIFDYEDSDPLFWRQREEKVRGIPITPNMLGNFDVMSDGEEIGIIVKVPSEENIYMYVWKDQAWNSNEPHHGTLFAVDRSGSLIIGNPTSESVLELIHIQHNEKQAVKCGDDMESLRISLTLDDSPSDIIWQFISYTSNSADILLRRGPYDQYNGVTIVEEICIRKDECVAFSIFDTNGNGLTAGKGKYAIFRNGKMKAAGDIYGFEKHQNILGQSACGDHPLSSRPWVDSPFYESCKEEQCEWIPVGKHIMGKSPGDEFGRRIELSKDGNIGFE